MRKVLILMAVITLITSVKLKGQVNELAQLALNVEKLLQFKSILSDLKKGYQIVSKGYGAVKDLSQGNFNLHKTFLDGLMEVSPAVRNYYKVGLIIDRQIKLVSASKEAFSRFGGSKLLNQGELRYLEGVYERLLSSSLSNLEELATVITAGKLRMSDDERLEAIDRMFTKMEGDFVFLQQFNSQAGMLVAQRIRERSDVEGMKSIYTIK